MLQQGTQGTKRPAYPLFAQQARMENVRRYLHVMPGRILHPSFLAAAAVATLALCGLSLRVVSAVPCTPSSPICARISGQA